MAAATIRLGKISSINYTAGKARVVYEDRDDSVTSELPFLALQYNICLLYTSDAADERSSPCSITYQR